MNNNDSDLMRELISLVAKHEVELNMITEMLQKLALHADALSDRLNRAEKELERTRKELSQISLVN